MCVGTFQKGDGEEDGDDEAPDTDTTADLEKGELYEREQKLVVRLNTLFHIPLLICPNTFPSPCILRNET